MDPLDDGDVDSGGGDNGGDTSTFDPLAANHDHDDDDDPHLTRAAARAAAAIGSNDDDDEDNHDFIIDQNNNGGTKRSADDAGLPDGNGNDGTVVDGSTIANNNNNDEMIDDYVMSPIKKQAMDGGEGQALAVAGARLTCKVDGCSKLRAKSGYCTRHFKDKSAPIRGPTTDYDKRPCMVEGCERLRSKGNYCHRHSKDVNAPIRNPGSAPSATTPSVKKVCKIDGCTRFVVKKGFCSRHARDSEAPVKKDPPFSFNADERWNELFPQLEAFAKKNGHARVPTSDRSSDLARFVIHIRSVYRNKKVKTMKKDPEGGNDMKSAVPDLSQSTLLTPERMEALSTIGFEFQLWTVDAMQWENRFQELMEHKKNHGTFHVTSKQNPTLSSWCKTQRQRYKNTMAVYQGMYQIPLSEHLKTGKGEELYKKANEKAVTLEASGENIAIAPIHKFSEAKHILDADKIVKLNAVGFEWDLQKDSYKESWEKRYSELMKYKIVNGNCRVPKASTEFPQLGHWVKQMRKYRAWKEEGKPYPSTFTQARIDRLDELSFEWRLKDLGAAKPGNAPVDVEKQEQVDDQPPSIAPAQQHQQQHHQQHMSHNGVHNPAYMGGNVNMNMNVNMNDPNRHYEMVDHNQYQNQQYHPNHQPHGVWPPNAGADV